MKGRFVPGLRIVKTMIAVFLCGILGYYLDRPPFLSMIAATITMQKDYAESYKFGKRRMIGTIIGGLYGIIFIFVFSSLGIQENSIMYLALVSLFIYPIIETNLYFKKRNSISLSMVVFLSITVSRGFGKTTYIYALSRVVETIVGIVISIAVNEFPFEKIISFVKRPFIK